MEDCTEHIIELERAALERWGKGDPGGFLEISADDVVYFDPYLEQRVDGREALRERYQVLWGKILVDRFELVNPKVQFCGDAAVLTFNYRSFSGDEESRWNCTEVFRKDATDWRIIQSHWSYTCHPAIVSS